MWYACPACLALWAQLHLRLHTVLTGRDRLAAAAASTYGRRHQAYRLSFPFAPAAIRVNLNFCADWALVERLLLHTFMLLADFYCRVVDLSKHNQQTMHHVFSRRDPPMGRIAVTCQVERAELPRTRECSCDSKFVFESILIPVKHVGRPKWALGSSYQCLGRDSSVYRRTDSVRLHVRRTGCVLVSRGGLVPTGFQRVGRCNSGSTF